MCAGARAKSVQANSLLTEVSAAIYQRGEKQVKKC